MQIFPIGRNAVFFWLTPIVLLLWRALIVAGVLLASTFFTYKVSTSKQLLVLVLVLATGAGLLLIRHAALGILFLISTIAIPNNGPSNSNLTMVVASALIGLWMFDMIVRQRAIQLVRSATVLPLVGLVAVATIAFGVGQLPWYRFAQHAPLGAQLGGLSLFYLSSGVFLVVAHRVQDLRWLKWAVWLFLAMGALVVMGNLTPTLFGRLSGQFFGDQALGSLFWTWLLVLAVSQALFNVELDAGWRIALGGLALATIYVMITQLWTWNSGWVPPFLSIAAMMVIARPRLGVWALLLGVAFVLFKSSALISAVMVGDNEYSYATRLEAWAIVWNIVKVNPLVGLGPANYYWYTPLFSIRGYHVSFNSHQQYVDLVAQTGILGLICYLWFFAAIGWVTWRLRNRVPPGFPRAYVYGALGGVIGTLIASVFGDWVIPFFYNITLGGFRASMLSWLFLGGVIALEQILMSREDEGEEQNKTGVRCSASMVQQRT